MQFHHHFSSVSLAFLARVAAEGWQMDSIELLSSRDGFSSMTLKAESTQWTANFQVAAKIIFNSPSGKWKASITVRNTDLDTGLNLGYGLIDMDDEFKLFNVDDIHTTAKDYNVLMLHGINLKPSRIEIWNLNYKGPFSQDLTMEEDFIIMRLTTGLTDQDIEEIRRGPAYRDADEDDANIEYKDVDVDFDGYIVFYDNEQRSKVVIQHGTFMVMHIDAPYGAFLYPYPRLTFNVRKCFTREGEASEFDGNRLKT